MVRGAEAGPGAVVGTEPALSTVPTAAPVARPAGRVGSLRWLAALQLLGLLLFQLFHQGEHTLELLQRRFGVSGAAPLLSGLDFEWIHFGANTLLLAGAASVLWLVGPGERAAWRSAAPVAWWALVGAVALQAFHVVEHVARVVQYAGGADPPPGLATRALDVVWFHWAVNLAFLAGLAAGFLGLGMHRVLVGLPGRGAPARG